MKLSSPLLLALPLLLAAALACARAEVPITPGGEVFTPPPAPPSPTSSLPTATSTATPNYSPTPDLNAPTLTPTPMGQRPFPNGFFDNDLGNWQLSDPALVTWQEGYARLSGGQGMTSTLQVPVGEVVLLRLSVRSEDLADGTCALDVPSLGDGRDFPRDNQWYDIEFDLTANNGLPFKFNPTAGAGCPAVHVDNVYWMVPPATTPPTAESTGEGTPVEGTPAVVETPTETPTVAP